ncbi:MAG: hypothetical protein IPM23_20840 [Candidatus Melainabacteria bacterium]|nr:hypothetical protein [Candidatus Melainabacteria bacterium]
MAEKQISEKKNSILGALSDLVIFLLFVSGAGFAGYYIGINQRLAPIETVPPGTVESLESLVDRATGNKAVIAVPPAPQPVETKTEAAKQEPEEKKPEEKKPEKNKKEPVKKKSEAAAPGNRKFYIVSRGSDYIGSSITVSINNRPIDNFFGPGKLIDISPLVRKGKNTIAFDARVMDDEYNQHLGDSSFALALDLVAGPEVTEKVEPGSVLVTYQRSGADVDADTKKVDFVVSD